MLNCLYSITINHPQAHSRAERGWFACNTLFVAFLTQSPYKIGGVALPKIHPFFWIICWHSGSTQFYGGIKTRCEIMKRSRVRVIDWFSQKNIQKWVRFWSAFQNIKRFLTKIPLESAFKVIRLFFVHRFFQAKCLMRHPP